MGGGGEYLINLEFWKTTKKKFRPSVRARPTPSCVSNKPGIVIHIIQYHQIIRSSRGRSGQTGFLQHHVAAIAVNNKLLHVSVCLLNKLRVYIIPLSIILLQTTAQQQQLIHRQVLNIFFFILLLPTGGLHWTNDNDDDDGLLCNACIVVKSLLYRCL